MKPRTQGMNWIRKEKRLAIYYRDDMRCVYCSCHVSDCVLTLDHIIPYSKDGSNDSSNLVTACRSCNSERGTKPFTTFMREKGFNYNAIQRLKRRISKPLDPEVKKVAKNLVESLSWDEILSL